MAYCKFCFLMPGYATLFVLILTVFSGCDESVQNMSLGDGPFYLSADDQSILGFEDANDWAGAGGVSTTNTEGNYSVEIAVNGWTEIRSANIAGVGPVGDDISVDLFIPDETPYWGELVLLMEMPSQGLSRTEVGRMTTIGRAAGTFETYTFTLSSQLKELLNGTYSDLKVTWVVNAPSGVYLLDNMRFSAGDAPDTDLSDDNVSLKVFIRYEGTHETNGLKPRMYIENAGDTAVRNFKVYYYFSIEQGKVPILEDYDTPFCNVYLQRLNEIQYRVVYDYAGYTLPAQGIVPNTAGNIVHIHYDDWSVWNKEDDVSYDGGSEIFAETTSVVIVGESDEILHGIVPVTSGAYKTHHGMDEDSLKGKLNEYENEYTISYIDAYADTDGTSRYAAIWRKIGDPLAAFDYNMTHEAYQAMFDDYVDTRGYRLVSVDGYNAADGTPRFAAIFHKVHGSSWTSFHNRTQEQILTITSSQQTEYGRYPVAINGYVGANGESQYAAIWEKTNESEPPVIHFDMSHDEYQNTYENMVGSGHTITHLDVHSNGDTTVFVSIWSQRYEPRRAVHGRSHTNYQNTFDNHMYSGHRLLKVTGYVEDNMVKYGAFWMPVYLSVSDWAYIKNEIEAEIDTMKIPAASVAISRYGKLLYAQGFGDDRGEPIGPYHRMRIASVSKSITGAAILKLIQEHPEVFDGLTLKDNLNKTVFGPNGILGTTYGTQPYSPYITQMTLNDFLEHTTGNWPGQGYTSDPSGSRTEYDATKPLDCNPIPQYVDNDTVVSMALDNSVDFTVNPDGTDNSGDTAWVGYAPHTRNSYSNFGYLVLGEVIEQISQLPYRDFVQTKIFEPLHIDYMDLSDYVTYAPVSPDPSRHVCDTRDPNSKTLLTKEVDYPNIDDNRNVQRMGAHGGWVAPAMDVVRFAWQQSGEFGTPLPDGSDDPSALNDYGLSNADADEYRTSNMAASSRYAKGVSIEPSGANAYRWFHGGSLDGTKARFWCQTDDAANADPQLNGFCVAMVVNTSVRPDPANPGGDPIAINHEDFEILLRRIVKNVSHWPDVDHFYGSH